MNSKAIFGGELNESLGKRDEKEGQRLQGSQFGKQVSRGWNNEDSQGSRSWGVRDGKNGWQIRWVPCSVEGPVGISREESRAVSH